MEYKPDIDFGLELFEGKMKLQERTGIIYDMFTNRNTGEIILIKSGRLTEAFSSNETYGFPEISDEFYDKMLEERRL